MKYILTILFIFSFQIIMLSQNVKKDSSIIKTDESKLIVIDEEEHIEIFIIPLTPPRFPGGDLVLRKFIAGKLVYPKQAKEHGIQGKVYIRFKVNRRGNISSVQVIKGVSPCLNAEAVRVIEGLPKWTPGDSSGRVNFLWCRIAINFEIK